MQQPGKRSSRTIKENTRGFVFITDVNELADSLLQVPLNIFAYGVQKPITVAKPAIFLRPLALAIHLLSRDFHILGSENRILGKTGKLKHVYSFQSSLFIQSEGITFADDGDLYISNERTGRKANILKLAYAPKD